MAANLISRATQSSAEKGAHAFTVAPETRALRFDHRLIGRHTYVVTGEYESQRVKRHSAAVLKLSWEVGWKGRDLEPEVIAELEQKGIQGLSYIDKSCGPCTKPALLHRGAPAFSSQTENNTYSGDHDPDRQQYRVLTRIVMEQCQPLFLHSFDPRRDIVRPILDGMVQYWQVYKFARYYHAGK